MTYRCNRCNRENAFVNQCGCDPNNMPTKPYSDSTRKIIEGAKKFAEEKRKEGMTREQAAEGLKKMLESETGESDLCLRKSARMEKFS